LYIILFVDNILIFINKYIYYSKYRENV